MSAHQDGKAMEISDLLKVLAHPTRLSLVCRLIEGECSVVEMGRELGILQPSLSQHLAELRQAALVSTRREHKKVFYTLTDERTTQVVTALYAIFQSNMMARVGSKRDSIEAARHRGAAMFARTGGAE